MNSNEVREEMVGALRLDIIGPTNADEHKDEVLSFAPSKMYLAGFLAPKGASVEARSDDTGGDELEQLDSQIRNEGDDKAPEKSAKKKNFFPSSIGISCIVSEETKSLSVKVEWGEYHILSQEEAEKIDVGFEQGRNYWRRTPLVETATVDLTKPIPDRIAVPNTLGLFLVVAAQPIPSDWAVLGNIPKNARALSVFLVNEKEIQRDEYFKDLGFIFQVDLSVSADQSFLPRPNLKGLILDDTDERIADVQYRDTFEFSVGHGVATENKFDTNNQCVGICTSWIPEAVVEKVVPSEDVGGIPLEMDVLASYKDGKSLQADLGKLVDQYSSWIASQSQIVSCFKNKRAEAGRSLVENQKTAARRLKEGIALLSEKEVLSAFCFANRVMADAAKQRNWFTNKTKFTSPSDSNNKPTWRPFQLAFILLNLKSIVEPTSGDRNMVDLLFFPTGGGKTEAYLGLSAFTLIFRRFKNPGLSSSGVSVLMRYTLRLLTLDQLGRAAGLICALEIERKKNEAVLGNWPFEIGLWVGRAATPNRLGERGDKQRETAKSRVAAYKREYPHKPSPIPLESCPWCGTKLGKESFNLFPNAENPTRLLIRCDARPNECAFAGQNYLPILGVDEEIYKRLPAFLIATVDKFASLPWMGEAGQLFGNVNRSDAEGYYGEAFPTVGTPIQGCQRLLPPDLIIQDELHLISGPMGTMVGLYEGAFFKLSQIKIGDVLIGPKIVASTATVRRAHRQIQALFGKNEVEIFPPPGINLDDSFFAKTKTEREVGRLYVGVAAQGRSTKVILLRVFTALLGAANKLYSKHTGSGFNNADPYMTLLSYFNSLRELGGARRIIEDEVTSWLQRIEARKRIGEQAGVFKNREIDRNLVELTSRVNTSDVSEAKRKLGLDYGKEGAVDVALATNMISVGLDITRLGLMAVFGQPKTTSEYIQSTSRVGRDEKRPGIVVTLYNVHRHRDRSFYERFEYTHKTFYRNVEASSVTPFSPRALDKGFAGAAMALVRHGIQGMTPARSAELIIQKRSEIEALLVSTFIARVSGIRTRPESEVEVMKKDLRDRISDLLDSWERIWSYYDGEGTGLQFANEIDGTPSLIYDFLDSDLDKSPMKDQLWKFRTGRSMRDVEAAVDIFVSNRGEEAQEENHE